MTILTAIVPNLAIACLVFLSGCVSCTAELIGIKDGFPADPPDPDAAIVGNCNPVAQAGCAEGEKCTWVVTAPSEGVTACVPDGSIGERGACTSGSETPGLGTGFDQCEAGLLCLFGSCNRICVDDSCGFRAFCVSFFATFTDQSGVGLCRTACDPVNQDCADPVSDGCYLNAVSTEATCTPVIAAGVVQGDACVGPAAGQCFQNGCEKGYGPFGFTTTGLPAFDSCAFFCQPTDTHTGAPGEAAGIPSGVNCASVFGGFRPDGPGPPFQCRFMQSFLADNPNLESDIGICADPGILGDCRSCDITNQTTFNNTCSPGCLSLETIDGIPP